MKKFMLIVTIVCLAAMVAGLCGCTACSREMMFESSSTPVEQLPQKSAVELPEEKPVFEPETEIEVEEEPIELPPLPMTADFEALAENHFLIAVDEFVPKQSNPYYLVPSLLSGSEGALYPNMIYAFDIGKTVVPIP